MYRISTDIAQGKAWTAAAYGTPSAAQKDKMTPMPIFSAAVTAMTSGLFTPQTGAVPVYRDGSLLGAVGASGGTGDQDEQVCREAVESFGLHRHEQPGHDRVGNVASAVDSTGW